MKLKFAARDWQYSNNFLTFIDLYTHLSSSCHVIVAHISKETSAIGERWTFLIVWEFTNRRDTHNL